MYKLILLASAANAEVHTKDLLDSACSVVSMLPEEAPQLVTAFMKNYLSESFANLYEKQEDMKDLTNNLIRDGCKNLKDGKSATEIIRNEWDLVQGSALPIVARQGAILALGENSALGQLSGDVVKLWQGGKLDNNIKRARIFVKIISEVDGDDNSHVSFEDVLPKKEAESVRTTLKEVKGLLEEADNDEETDIKCGSQIAIKLQFILKDGIYDEVLSYVPKPGKKAGELATISRELAVRAAVSKAVSLVSEKIAGCSEQNRLLLA